ncbi:MAG: GntR family transcriptional regulator [Bacillota bacterium]|nr:GntR family transcriptional regulator [Bacillota bacterium]
MKKKPQYIAIADDIENKIQEGEYKKDSQLPTELELCEIYQVSRMTINKAIVSLVNKGLLYRVAGKGTFVKDLKVFKEAGFVAGSSFTSDMEQINQVAGSKLLEYKVIRACQAETAMKHLHLDEDDLIYYIQRLRTGNGTPIALSTTYIPCSIVPVLDINCLETSLYKYLKDNYNLSPSAISYTFEAMLPTSKQKKLLQIDSGAVLKSCHPSVDMNTGQYVEYTETYYVGTRYKYSIHFQEK